MLETTRIRREGYSVRIPFNEFVDRWVGECVCMRAGELVCAMRMRVFVSVRECLFLTVYVCAYDRASVRGRLL